MACIQYPCTRCPFPAVLRSTLEEVKACIEQLHNMQDLVRRLSRSSEGTFMGLVELCTVFTLLNSLNLTFLSPSIECVQQSFDRICNSGQSNPGRYCHAKLAEWWQWYEPYYAFPIQVFHDPTNHPPFCIDLSLLSNSFMFLCPGEAEGEKCHCSAQHSLSCSIQRIPQERRLLGLLERERVRDLLPGKCVRGGHSPAHLQLSGGCR